MVAASATLLHLMAAYTYCALMMIIISLSDVILTPKLLEYETRFAGVDIDSAVLKSTNTTNVVKSPVIYMVHEPYTAKAPLQFSLYVHSPMILLLLFDYSFLQLRKSLRLPRISVLRRRLKTQSRIGRLMVHVHEQFDDCLIEGLLGSPSTLKAAFHFVIPGIAWLMYTIAFRASLEYASAPLGHTLQYFFILIVPPLMFPILREKINGLKIIAAMISFIGVYLHFFPEPVEPTGHSSSDTIQGIFFGFLSAAFFALYLLYYKLLNPGGRMIRVLGYQALTTVIIGWGIATIRHLWNIEQFLLPPTSDDWILIGWHSIFRFLIMFCINEALRWGEPVVIATALAMTPSLSYFMQVSNISVSAPSAFSRYAALAMVSIGFAIVAMYHLGRALSGCTMLSSKPASSVAGATASERQRLIVGDEDM